MRTGRLPLELAGGEEQYLGLTADEEAAADQAAQALLADLRFEHVHDVGDVVWDFLCKCWVDKATDHVPAFLQSHACEVADHVCYIPVEFLSVTEEIEVLGIRLLRVDDARIPAPGPWFNLDKPVGSVAAIDATGTSHERMAERARVQATHVLRLLRVALREHPAIHDRQLRFQLAIGHSFETGQQSGWTHRDDVAYELDLGGGGDLLGLVATQPIATMPLGPSTDVDKKADLALRWMERAWLSGDPLTALLFLFFALEALLGDKSEGLKAHGLAFRQTMLSHVLTGGFTHPNETWFLYDRVRSGAVHGEDVPDLSWETVHSFASVVRRALNQYLGLARQHDLAKRGRLLKMLDEHADRPLLIAWLRQGGGPVWTPYLDRIDPPGASSSSESRE